jgi:cob(I)alamin adenosyltransferase
MGDDGSTRLLSGETVSKADPRVAVYGDLDEAVSALGLARALTGSGEIGSEIRDLQQLCFIAGAELAALPPAGDKLRERIGADQLAALEDRGAELEAQVDLPPVFVIPGSTPGSAALDLARTILRRVERGLVALLEADRNALDNPVLVPWFNRLSDILFLLARLEEQQQGLEYDRTR